ncbi:MAG: hypothetical protein SXA11_16805 [Cyanobacteriota bacterium]|nr:hypothetical protein [Cyanobacteriota bacterium]
MISIYRKLGEENAQLFRELKGRLNPRNVALALGISFVAQLLIIMSCRSELPFSLQKQTTNKYCTGSLLENYYNEYNCIKDITGNWIINWQVWWLQVFIILSLVSTIALLTVGAYMLIGDLSREERNGTLNFIRLSPQSTQNIFLGKLLGVPILLYLGAAAIIPLHLWSGLAAEIPLPLILSFDLLLVVCGVFIYSAALLFGLVNSWMGGFQSWLGSGIVLASTVVFSSKYITLDGWDIIDIFSPTTILPYLVPRALLKNIHIFDWTAANRLSELQNWEWFYLPIGASVVGVMLFAIFNYCVWTALIWRSLKRCFRDRNATLLSKRQSYIVTACFTALSMGFALQHFNGGSERYGIPLAWNFLLFCGLIASLSPQRQALQDWARYRREGGKKRKFHYLMRDLIWGEKSPAVVALDFNLLIVAALFVPAVLLVADRASQQMQMLLALLLNVGLILICATIAQLMLLMKVRKRALWAAGTVGTLIILPLLTLAFLSVQPYSMAMPFLFTALSFTAVKEATATSIFVAILSQFSVLVLLNLRLKQQLLKAGESASKALLKA